MNADSDTDDDKHTNRRAIFETRAARIILQRESSRNTFDILNWVELSTRRKIHKCVSVFKCLNNLVPEYLSGYFTRNSSIHSYNTRRKNNLHLPKPNLSVGGDLLYIQDHCFITIFLMK